MAALGFSDHTEQAGSFEHGASELIHTCRRGWAGWANDFVAHRVNRAYVIDEATFHAHGKLFAFGEHISHFFVRSVAAGEHFTAEQNGLAGFPFQYIRWRYCIEVDATNFIAHVPADFWPVRQ